MRPALLVGLALLLSHVARAEESKRWIEQISWEPRAYLFHNLLSDEEADHVVALAKPHITRSSVLNEDDSVSAAHDIRTSYGTFLSPAQDDVISRIEHRISQWVRLPVENFENMQVLKYVDGQKYDAHWDERSVEDGASVGGGSRRIATVLMYLSDVAYGGETAFPHGYWLDAAVQNRSEFSPCAAQGPAALARKGDAILFWDMKPDGVTLDRYSMHTGCPVLEGEKWSSTFWIHAAPMRLGGDGGGRAAQQATPLQSCRDSSVHCVVDVAATLSKGGKCDSTLAGRCRRSCGTCCHAGDVLCERRLRRDTE